MVYNKIPDIAAPKFGTIKYVNIAMFHLQPTRTVRSSLWAVSFCVYTRSILVRADCTTGTTKHENAIIVVGLAEPQRKNPLGDRQPHSCRGTRAVSS